MFLRAPALARAVQQPGNSSSALVSQYWSWSLDECKCGVCLQVHAAEGSSTATRWKLTVFSTDTAGRTVEVSSCAALAVAVASCCDSFVGLWLCCLSQSAVQIRELHGTVNSQMYFYVLCTAMSYVLISPMCCCELCCAAVSCVASGWGSTLDIFSRMWPLS